MTSDEDSKTTKKPAQPTHFAALMQRFGAGASNRRLCMMVLPLLTALLLLIVVLMPGTNINENGSVMRILRVPDFPVTLVLEQNEGVVKSAWLRTPAGAREVFQIEGMTFIAASLFRSRVDADTADDVLWRVSFTNFDGIGVHLWVGLTTWQPTAYIFTSPYEYTRWDVIPAKVVVPKGTAVYVSPATPSYGKAGQFNGRDSYSFVYTVRMTPEGPAFVPVPSVYKQLAVLLKAGLQGEFNPMKRLAYVRMLTEFNDLANDKPPHAETLINFPMNKVDVLTWKK